MNRIGLWKEGSQTLPSTKRPSRPRIASTHIAKLGMLRICSLQRARANSLFNDPRSRKKRPRPRRAATAMPSPRRLGVGRKVEPYRLHCSARAAPTTGGQETPLDARATRQHLRFSSPPWPAGSIEATRRKASHRSFSSPPRPARKNGAAPHPSAKKWPATLYLCFCRAQHFSHCVRQLARPT